MKISASIYSNTGKNLEELIPELDNHHIDYFHVDCVDNLNVFDDIKKIRSLSKTPVDLHIISSQPEKFFEPIVENKVELVSFQHENLKKGIKIPSEMKSRFGIAIVSETPIDIFKKYLPDRQAGNGKFSFILFMTTTPGQSGGKFNKETFRKIREFRSKYPGVRIHVDGGVNEEVSFILRNMGVYAAVTGSYLMNADSIGAAMLNLKKESVESHYLVKDFMIPLEETPVLKTKNLKFADALKSVEDFAMGFTIVADEKGRMKGIISNADVRRGLMKHLNDLNKIKMENLINPKPVCANENQTVKELLEMIKSQSFPILYLPVVNDENKVAGALKFNNLIKGEL